MGGKVHFGPWRQSLRMLVGLL